MYKIVFLFFGSSFFNFCFAQTSITQESFYKKAHPQQVAIVHRFLQSDSVQLSLNDFLFINEEDMDTATQLGSTEPKEKLQFKFMPFNKTKTKCLDLGFTIAWDKKEKKYYTEGDHGQYVSLLDFQKKTYQQIWVSHGWYPATDYAIWFGNTAFALFICNSDQEDNPQFNFYLEYYDLINFWNFYFKEILKGKR
jgi:hypothetical protein